ncbi:MAG: hypothetical protein ACREMQ_02040 [Longimicrobiales bacterium]
MREHKKLFALTVLGVGAAVSLGMGTAAQTAQETFRLASVAGQPLPALIEQEGDCREELTAATLTLETNGRWMLVSTEREVCGTRVDDEEERENGTYTTERQTLRFLDDDGKPPVDDDDDELDVSDLVTGTRSADGLVVRLADGKTDLTFRR